MIMLSGVRLSVRAFLYRSILSLRVIADVDHLVVDIWQRCATGATPRVVIIANEADQSGVRQVTAHVPLISDRVPPPQHGFDGSRYSIIFYRTWITWQNNDDRMFSAEWSRGLQR